MMSSPRIAGALIHSRPIIVNTKSPHLTQAMFATPLAWVAYNVATNAVSGRLTYHLFGVSVLSSPLSGSNVCTDYWINSVVTQDISLVPESCNGTSPGQGQAFVSAAFESGFAQIGATGTVTITTGSSTYIVSSTDTASAASTG